MKPGAIFPMNWNPEERKDFAGSIGCGERKISRALVVLPTYNERENLPLMVDELLKIEPPVDIVVVDDGSPDGTGDIAGELSEENPRINVIHRAGKLGLGTAYLAGFRFGLERGYELLISMDCDFSHNPNYLPEMMAKADEADLVIGSRYTEGGGTKGWPLKRRLISRAANLGMRFLLGLRTRDSSAGFRCYRCSALKTIGLDAIRSTGYNALEEMAFRSEKAGLKIAEIPIIFEERRLGKTKMSFNDMLGVALLAIRLRFEPISGRLRRR